MFDTRAEQLALDLESAARARDLLERSVGKPHDFHECCCIHCVFWAKHGRRVEWQAVKDCFL